MFSIVPSINPEIAKIAPEFRALSIVVKASSVINPDVGKTALHGACRAIHETDVAWAHQHLSAWSEVFTRFGAKPKRTPCSAEALRKRVLRDGDMPSIDPVVDLYNAISIKYAIPVGGENISAYVGHPQLTIANGSELFDVMKNGMLSNESPDKGEVIWRDNIGVTCRRWNWRQGVRTRLSIESEQMWFILESLPSMPLTGLYEAGESLIEGLKNMMPDAIIEQSLIGFGINNNN